MATLLNSQFLRELTGKHLLLQPHLDDLAFSLGHVLGEGVIDISQAEGWTIFGREFFNIRDYPHNEATVELLKKEETRWFEAQGLRCFGFELEEAGYRGITGVRKLFLAKNATQLDLDYDSLEYGNGEQVREKVRLLAGRNFDYIWAPAGVGGHCDHLALRQAVLKLAPQFKHLKGILFYEELPYLVYSHAIEWEDYRIDGFEVAGKVIKEPSESERIRKYEGLLVYHSQITERQAAALAAQRESLIIWLRRNS